MHAQMKGTRANLQDLIPTLAGIIISSTNQGLNLVDLLESVFNLCIHGCTYPAGIVFI